MVWLVDCKNNFFIGCFQTQGVFLGPKFEGPSVSLDLGAEQSRSFFETE